MKNWDTLDADVVKIMNKNFTKGRGGKKIDMIVIHHNAGVLSIDQIWQVWQSRPASAHYQVEVSGRIGQLVWDGDTAYHAANWDINQRSIGIEFSNSGGAAQGWPIANKTVEEGAHLVAALCKFYKLGRPKSGGNVRFHREFTGTSCPERLAPGGALHAKLFERAQYWYDQMVSGKAPASTGAQAPATKGGSSVATPTSTHWPDGPAALNDAKLAAQGADAKLDTVLAWLNNLQEQVDQVAFLANLAIDQLVGPGRDKDGKPTFSGWSHAGQDAQGRDLTMMDTGVAARHDIARIEDQLGALIALMKEEK